MTARRRRALAAVAATVLAATLATAAAVDVIHLRNGDRVSGEIVGETSRSFRIQTPYGRLVIPRGKIARVQRKTGREVVLNPPEPALESAPLPSPAAPVPAELVLVILGKTFWHAWDRGDAPPDPSLRFEVSLDETVVAAYVDGALDPQDMPGAVVNTFSFAAEDVRLEPGPRVLVTPPEVRPGRIVMRIGLPPGNPAEQRLRLAYQANTGTAAAPAWRDLAEGSLALSLLEGTPRFVQVRQDRGSMEYAGFPRRRMRNVATFRVDPLVE